MKKKFALLFAAGLLSMTMFSGCGGDDYDIVVDDEDVVDDTNGYDVVDEDVVDDVIGDVTDEGGYGEYQNPFMNFTGTYAYSRLYITIECLGEDEGIAHAQWAQSASETYYWEMTGRLGEDGSNPTMFYDDCVETHVIIDDDGNETSEVIYENGTGFIQFNFMDGTIEWNDDVEGTGDGMVLENISGTSENDDVDVISADVIDTAEYDTDVNMASFIGDYTCTNAQCTISIKACTEEYHEVNIELVNGLDVTGLNCVSHWRLYPYYDAENGRLYADHGPLFYEWYDSDGEFNSGDQVSDDEQAYFYFSGDNLIWVDRKNNVSDGFVFERVN